MTKYKALSETTINWYFTEQLNGVFRTLSSIYDGVFPENVSKSELLTIFSETSVTDVWQGRKYASAVVQKLSRNSLEKQ